RLKYNAGSLAASADSDGDGASNAQEAGAGTNPFAPSDIIAIRDLQRNGNALTLHWPSVLGKRYKVQSSTNVTNPNAWTDLSAAYLDATGAEMSEVVVIGGA